MDVLKKCHYAMYYLQILLSLIELLHTLTGKKNHRAFGEKKNIFNQ